MRNTSKSGVKAKNSSLTLQAVDGLTVEIIPNPKHEFLMTSDQVAEAYGIHRTTLNKHRSAHSHELKHDVHFTHIVVPTSTGGCRKTAYTKAGVIRLGMFIKSERAARFRDWAERLILDALDHKVDKIGRPIPMQRNINRLTPQRLLDIMADIVHIEDAELRLRLAAKVLGKGGEQ